MMWYDNIPTGRGWTFLWTELILCNCGAIRKIKPPCPVCDSPSPKYGSQAIALCAGREVVSSLTFMGAEGRYEDYVYLEMIQKEWDRPSSPVTTSTLSGISHKASVVLLFWTYFETRIERLLRSGMSDAPSSLCEDALDRYSSIGARLTKLFKVVFGNTYESELKNLGYEGVWDHLKDVQQRRNRFMHGHPEAIDDDLVHRVVANLEMEHVAWIEVYNLHRAQKVPKAP